MGGKLRSCRDVRAGALAVLCFASAVLAAAQSASFARGETLFRENKPREAAALLEQAAREDPRNERAWLYLGTCYQLLDRYDDALRAFRSGLSAASTLSPAVFYYHLGNIYILQGKNAFAEEMYGQAIKARPEWAPPFLNRANTRMAQGNHKDAASDYVVYLTLDPGSPQAEAIRRLVERLGRAEAEESARLAEEEARRLAEEQARQALLEAVAQSLRESAEETESMSAGTEELQGYEEELILED